MNLIYKPKFNNIDSFIAYKFSIMPSSVINNESFEDSYPQIFMNNEILSVIEIKLIDIFDFINLEEFVNIRKLINEEINFYDSYDEKTQEFSKINKLQKKYVELTKKQDLLFAKYQCFKEAYDLELDKEKIYNFDIKRAIAIKNIIDKIISPIYSEKISQSVRKVVIEQLNKDIKRNSISTTFETGYSLYNINHFKAFVCSNDILEKIDALYNQNKLSSESIDFCVDVLALSIYAKNRVLKKEKQFVIDEKDIESFDKETAQKLKNKLICKKYRENIY